RGRCRSWSRCPPGVVVGGHRAAADAPDTKRPAWKSSGSAAGSTPRASTWPTTTTGSPAAGVPATRHSTCAPPARSGGPARAGRAGGAGPVLDAGEHVAAAVAAGEAAPELLLLDAEHVDGERAVGGDDRAAGAAAPQAHQHQRRLERDGGERVGGDAVGPAGA